jgi:protease I
MEEEGIDVDIASLVRGRVTGKHGQAVEARLGIGEVRTQDFDALILPGGRAPATLRKSRAVLEIVRAFFDAGKPICAICHGPQILVSAGILTGRSATCYATVADELRAAGAHYQNSDVVVDGSIVTSRQPADLPAFLRETLRKLREWQTRAAGAHDVGGPLAEDLARPAPAPR